MEVIDFTGTKQIIHGGDDIKKVYVGNDLMWKVATKLVGVYSRDEVDLEGLESVDTNVRTVYFDGYLSIAFKFLEPKYIEFNGQFIEIQEGELHYNPRAKTGIFETYRFTKPQAEQLLGITIDDPDQKGIPIPDSVDIKAWG